MGARRAVAVAALSVLSVLTWPETGSAQRPGTGTGLRVTGLVGGSFQEGSSGFGLVYNGSGRRTSGPTSETRRRRS